MRKVLAVAALLAAPQAEAAASFYDRYVLGPEGVPPCYARTYADDHLAAHPKQKVVRFHLTKSALDGPGPPRSFDMSFGSGLRDSRDVFAAEAGCTARGDGAVCSVEGDGGGFTLTPRPDGLLVSVDGRLQVEGMDGFSPDLFESDDREFRLYASPAEECPFDASGGGDGPPAIEPLAPTLSRPD